MTTGFVSLLLSACFYVLICFCATVSKLSSLLFDGSELLMTLPLGYYFITQLFRLIQLFIYLNFSIKIDYACVIQHPNQIQLQAVTWDSDWQCLYLSHLHPNGQFKSLSQLLQQQQPVGGSQQSMQGLQSEAVRQPGHCSPAIEICNEMGPELVFIKFLTSCSDFIGTMSYHVKST